jgi:hypothetical protein
MAGGLTIDAKGFNDSMDALIKRINEATKKAVGIGAILIQANARANFEGSHPRGKPHVGGNKPNVQIPGGKLRESISLIPESPVMLGPGKYTISVAPTMIYGRRVELGFTGTDSLGRHFNQPPYPYLQPGVDKALPVIPRIFRDA